MKEIETPVTRREPAVNLFERWKPLKKCAAALDGPSAARPSRTSWQRPGSLRCRYSRRALDTIARGVS
jgi:hypothetical protein